MGYADVEKLLVTCLPPLLDGAGIRVATDVPANLDELLAAGQQLVQVTRFGGGDDAPTLDRAHVDTDCFAATKAAAHELAERLRSVMRFDLPGNVIDGAVIAKVTTLSGPIALPWGENTAVHRYGAAYAVLVHSA